MIPNKMVISSLTCCGRVMDLRQTAAIPHLRVAKKEFQQLTGCKNEEHIVRRASSKHILRLLPQEWELQELREVRTDKGRPDTTPPGMYDQSARLRP